MLYVLIAVASAEIVQGWSLNQKAQGLCLKNVQSIEETRTSRIWKVSK